MLKCLICDNSTDTFLLLNLSNGFLIYLCRKCQLAFTHPQPVQPAYENLDFHLCTKENKAYNNHLTGIDGLPYDWRKLIELQTSLITNNLPSKKNILEIGCGEGILLHEFKKIGFNVTGIEPSSNATTRAKGRNLNIIKGSFPDVELYESFDLVIMSQVLEHVYDLDEFICEIIKIIPSGFLLLTQTNLKGLIPSIQKEKWYGWVPEQHFWHFTLEGLTKYLLKFGFKRIDYRYSSLVHPHDFLYKLASLKDSWLDQFTVLFKLDEGS